MERWLNEPALWDFGVVFLPALIFFMLVRSYLIVRWAWRSALALTAVAFLGSYHLSGYPRVLFELMSHLAQLHLPYAAGFVAAFVAAGSALRLIRGAGSWHQRHLEPSRHFGTIGGPSRIVSASIVGLLVALPPLWLVAGSLAAQAPGNADVPEPTERWRPLIAMNQLVLDKDLHPVCHCAMPITATQVPRHLTEALVAVEDRRFYIHRGIDPLAMLRAVRVWLSDGRVEGGSTLSQQLAKFVFLSGDRTLMRKGLDIVWGLRIDAALSKKEIVVAYLNRVSFGWWRGRPIVGVEQASRHFFGKRSRELNLYEAAALAAMINAPVRLNPKRRPKLVARRAREVLRRMEEEGFITRKEAVAALISGVRRGQMRPQWVEPRYFAEWAMTELAELAPDLTPTAGLRLFVSLDSISQSHAELAVLRMLDKQSQGQAGEAGLVALDYDGRVRAMVGGRDFGTSQFNRAVQARRQPASTFKPFVYLAALESGIGPETMILDAPPEGVGAAGKPAGPYHGLLTVERALALSANGAAVRLAQRVGFDKVAAATRRLGITSQLRQDGSLALGTSEVSLIELTAAYSAFANGGRLCRPHGIMAVVDRGRFRYLPNQMQCARAIDELHAMAMRKMLRAVVAEGTGRPANIAISSAGKTGTSQDNRDALFVGFTGNLVAGMWMGNDDQLPMRGATGQTVAAAWANFMANELAR